MSQIIENDFNALNQFLSENNYDQIFVLVDQNTRHHCFPLVESYLQGVKLIEIAAGESNKQLSTCSFVWQELAANRASRHSLLINLGGGMVCDLGGFIASTYKRGMDYLLLPTSLLAMVDASIGGKTGVDFNGIKNMIGTITSPKSVLIHPQFLKTLPTKQILSGYAEMIKHGMIADEKYLYELLNKNIESIENWEELILTSIAIKSNIVNQDPKEKGLRKVLNFGHTIGHALESFFLNDENNELLHGEAIACGMIVECYLSIELLHFKEQHYDALRGFVLKHYPKISLTHLQLDKVIELMYQDKKNKANNISFTLLEDIAKPHFDIICTEKNIREAMQSLGDVHPY